MDEPRLHRPLDRAFQLVWRDKAGKKRKISLGTRDEDLARQYEKTAVSKWNLDIPFESVTDLQGEKKSDAGPITFDDFFRKYEIALEELRERSQTEAKGRLRIARKFSKGRLLKEFASHESLLLIRAGFLRITDSKHTAKSRMASVLAALNWACAHGMLEYVPKVPPIKTAKLDAMKGRPLEPAELKAYRKALADVVGKDRAKSWLFLADGLTAQCLRLGEGLAIHWTDRKWIVPDLRGANSSLRIPAKLQKNNTEEEIPMTKEFHDLLLSVPVSEREGFVFNPAPLRAKRWKRDSRTVGRTFSRAGEKSGIITVPEDGKFASAHDLRRTGIQHLADMDTPIDLTQRVARHRHISTTERYYLRRKAQRDTAKLWELDTTAGHKRKAKVT